MGFTRSREGREENLKNDEPDLTPRRNDATLNQAFLKRKP